MTLKALCLLCIKVNLIVLASRMKKSLANVNITCLMRLSQIFHLSDNQLRERHLNRGHNKNCGWIFYLLIDNSVLNNYIM